MQNLGQTSASNISSALSSIMGLGSNANTNATTNASSNVTTTTSNVPISTTTTNPVNNVKAPPYSTSQQKNIYPNISTNNVYTGDPYYPGNVYTTAKSPKNAGGAKPIIFKGPEEKERPESAYAVMDKKRASNPPTTTTHTEPDLYSKKFAPSSQLGGPQIASSHSGISGPQIGSSSKYTGPSYQLGLSKGTQESSKPNYQLGLSKNTESTATSNLSKGSTNKYGLLNLNGLNKPGGLLRSNKES